MSLFNRSVRSAAILASLILATFAVSAQSVEPSVNATNCVKINENDHFEKTPPQAVTPWKHSGDIRVYATDPDRLTPANVIVAATLPLFVFGKDPIDRQLQKVAEFHIAKYVVGKKKQPIVMLVFDGDEEHAIYAWRVKYQHWHAAIRIGDDWIVGAMQGLEMKTITSPAHTVSAIIASFWDVRDACNSLRIVFKSPVHLPPIFAI